MPYAAVLFDLFGTLVAPFRRAEHIESIRVCSEALGISNADCHRLWVGSFPERVRGGFGSVRDNFEWIVREAGGQVDRNRLDDATLLYERFTLDGLTPVDGALDLLEWLRARDMKIGLVTNCAPDVPLVWERSAFAPFFDHCSFSSLCGRVKPEPEIYHGALTALGAEASSTLYVGDGSDEELTGALAVGMIPVLVTNDLSNTYDATRQDVDGWPGRRVGRLEEIRDLFSPLETA
jgi:putative hydrolase of the HAD superfamily